MKRVRHSRSGLFLIELMICILFFSITAGICIQFFVKSHNMSQDAKNLYQAQQEAASMAEILEKDIDSLDNISVYYDKDWNQCDKEEKMYWLEVTQAQNQAQEDDLKKVKIAVYSGENSKGESSKKRRNLSFEPEYLYTLKERDIMDKYIPESTTHDLKVMGL
ncbi:MAG: type II secretion system protein J [Anaerobutyricum soehngenii]